MVIERKVFHTGDNGLQSMRCPYSGHQHAPDHVPWAEATDAWFIQDGGDSMNCSGNARRSSVVEQKEVVQLVEAGQKSAADAARQFNVHPATVARLLAKSTMGTQP